MKAKIVYPGLALHFEEAVDYLENVWRKNRGEEHLSRTLEKKRERNWTYVSTLFSLGYKS